MYRLSAPLYTLVIPRSEWTIYHEVFTGPWSKDGANKYASFAPKENDIEGIKEYIFKITGSTIEDLSI